MSYSSNTPNTNGSTPPSSVTPESEEVTILADAPDADNMVDISASSESTASAGKNSAGSFWRSGRDVTREQDSDDQHAFDHRVQQLLIALEDEINVDLLLMSGDHDSPELLAVKNIWLERRTLGLTDQLDNLRITKKS